MRDRDEEPIDKGEGCGWKLGRGALVALLLVLALAACAAKEDLAGAVPCLAVCLPVAPLEGVCFPMPAGLVLGGMLAWGAVRSRR